MRIAPQAPTMLPVPTWAAIAVATAWKELMPLLVLFAVQAESAEQSLQPFAKAANLHEAGTNGKEQTCTDKQDDQYVIRQIRVDGLDD